MAHAARNDYEIKQVDVKTAFLNGNFNKDIYMEIPEIPTIVIDELMERMKHNGMNTVDVMRQLCDSIKSNDETTVLKLNRSIYGLRQAAKEWHLKLKQVLMECGCKQSTSDPCLFIVKNKSGRRSSVLFYVDDIIIAAPTTKECQKIESTLGQKFEMGPMEETHYFLGMKIIRQRIRKSLSISQQAYIEKIAHKFRMKMLSSAIPLRQDAKLEKASIESRGACNKPYRELVGSLMYLACTVRPDIMYASSYLARFLSCYNDTHWTEAKRVLRYLVSTSQIGLCYGMTDKGIVGYTDADWAGGHVERKSTGGYVFTTVVHLSHGQADDNRL